MATLSISPEGQIKMPEEVLRHWNVHPGESFEVDLLPNGHIAPAVPHSISKRTGTWADVAGFLARDTNIKLTIEEIGEFSGPEWDPEK